MIKILACAKLLYFLKERRIDPRLHARFVSWCGKNTDDLPRNTASSNDVTKDLILGSKILVLVKLN
jgi:hypothetical protein